MEGRLTRHRHRPRSRLVNAAVAAALVVSSAVVALTQATPSYAGTEVNVWLTTPDQTNKLDPQDPVTFGSAGSGDVITVNPKKTYQSIVGFGGSLTHAAAYNIGESPPLSRDKIMKDLFGPGGLSLSFLRQPIGTSDFAVATSDPAPGKRFYSLDDVAPGSTDPDLSEFSIDRDKEYIIPLVQKARELNPHLTVMASPWSAPGWMKTGYPDPMKPLIGGSLKVGNESVFAKYLTRFVKAYDGAGIPITYLTVENEPLAGVKRYPSMTVKADQASTIINLLGPELRAAGFGTKILAWDHNWDNTSYPLQVLKSAGSNTAGVAWHHYGGNVTNQTVVRTADPSKEVLETEASWEGWEGSRWDQLIKGQGGGTAINTLRNWSRTVTFWNLALDPTGGPKEGNSCNCTAPVTTDGDKVTYNAEYYVLGHFSKFVKPGAVRIDSNVIGTDIKNVAFRNTDGTIALVAQNMGSSSKKFQVSYGGSSFEYELDAGAMATFTWPGSSSADGVAGPVIGYQGLCLDVRSANTADETPVQVYNCNGTDAQKWTATTSDTLQALGKCLDVKNAGKTDRTPVQLFKCNGTAAQVWQHQSNGTYLNPNSGKCLDDTDYGGSGTQLQIWTCTGKANQRWSPW